MSGRRLEPAVEPHEAASAVTELASPAARTIWVDLLLYPTHSLPTAAAPVLVGVGLAAHDGMWALAPALVGFLGSWIIHVAGLFADNHELLRRHPELPEHPELTRAIRDGTLKLSTLRLAIAGCLALTLLTVPYLHGIGGDPVLWFGALGIGVSLSYHVGPWSYVRRGHADPIFVVMFGIIGVVGTYFIEAAAVNGAPEPWRLLWSLPLRVWLVGLPAGAIVTAVMLVDDMRDHAFDRLKGWRTGSVVFGLGFTRWEIASLVGFAYVAPFVFALVLGPGALLPLVSAPMAWRTVRAVWTARERRELVPMTPRMARVALVHSLLLGAGLALGG